MSTALVPLLAHEQAAAYALYREGMMAGLRRIAAWDDALQRHRFADSYGQATLYWYQEDHSNRALLSISRDGDRLTLHLLVVPAKWQRHGSGRRAMLLLHGLCHAGGCVRLSCLRHDRRVRAFYAALGYRIVHAGAEFLDLQWQAPA